MNENDVCHYSMASSGVDEIHLKESSASMRKLEENEVWCHKNWKVNQ